MLCVVAFWLGAASGTSSSASGTPNELFVLVGIEEAIAGMLVVNWPVSLLVVETTAGANVGDEVDDELLLVSIMDAIVLAGARVDAAAGKGSCWVGARDAGLTTPSSVRFWASRGPIHSHNKRQHL